MSVDLRVHRAHGRARASDRLLLHRVALVPHEQHARRHREDQHRRERADDQQRQLRMQLHRDSRPAISHASSAATAQAQSAPAPRIAKMRRTSDSTVTAGIAIPRTQPLNGEVT